MFHRCYLHCNTCVLHRHQNINNDISVIFSVIIVPVDKVVLCLKSFGFNSVYRQMSKNQHDNKAWSQTIPLIYLLIGSSRPRCWNSSSILQLYADTPESFDTWRPLFISKLASEIMHISVEFSSAPDGNIAVGCCYGNAILPF